MIERRIANRAEQHAFAARWQAASVSGGSAGSAGAQRRAAHQVTTSIVIVRPKRRGDGVEHVPRRADDFRADAVAGEQND